MYGHRKRYLGCLVMTQFLLLFKDRTERAGGATVHPNAMKASRQPAVFLKHRSLKQPVSLFTKGFPLPFS